MTQYKPKIVLVEDDLELAKLIRSYLENHNFEVITIHDGEAALNTVLEESPELLILDLMLPNKDGMTICRELRPIFHSPILMLTASDDSIDEIVGLELGADDYVRKPVEPRTLLARVKALLRRSGSDAQLSVKTAEVLIFSDLAINVSARSVVLGTEELDFSVPEFETLLHLANNAGSVLSRDDLFKHLKNIEYDGQNRFVDITVSQIRKKIGPTSDLYLKTVRGQGYLFLLHP